MSKKAFKDTKVGQFLLEKIPNVVGSMAGATPVGGVIKAIIGGSDMSAEDKAIALKKLELEQAEMDAITRRWEADAKSGMWLTANVRPLTLVFFSIAYVVGCYLDYSLDSITVLMQLIFASYF